MPAAASQTATQSSPLEAVIDEPMALKVSLIVAGQSRRARYCVSRPAGHGPGQLPPLLVVLHGTDDTAQQMLEFWSGLKSRLPLIVAAPQGIAPGWCEEDVPVIDAMLEHLRTRVSFDPNRVMLAGFSAGGAMAFHMLYRESFPATAVAALANYVPPNLSVAQIRAQRHVPVFYAVGMEDVNHERMRDGIDRLRAAGGDIELYRPPIGHKLDPQVAQAALDWLLDQSEQQTAAMIQAASSDPDIENAALRLERLIAQARWHLPAQVELAREALERLNAPGRQQLAEANGLQGAGQSLAAIDVLLKVEKTYGRSEVGREARDRWEHIKADPDVRRQWDLRAAQRRNDEAFAKYVAAQRLIADRKLDEAAATCRDIMAVYPETVAAQRAGRLLENLERASLPR